MAHLKQLIREIHRRSLWQVLGIYVGASWALLTVVDTMVGALSLPGWATSLALFLLVIGLPVVLATAFVQEGMTTKEPEADPQPLDEVGEVPPPSAPEATGRQRLLTWRNAMFGGIGAFAVLGVLSAGWLATRSLGIGPAATLISRGVIEEADQIVLADFDDLSDDASLSRSVTELVRSVLEQSPVVRLLGPNTVRAVLEAMELPPDSTIVTLAIAQEIASREGLKAVLTGDVSRLGGTTVLTARLVAADGEPLLIVDEPESDSTKLVAAVDRLVKQLRERMGERLRTVRASPPLERAMTPSLPALRLFTEGVRLMREEGLGRSYEASEQFRQATEIDSTFALAYWRRAWALRDGYEDRQGQVNAISRAFELRDRLSDVDRLIVEETYFSPIFRSEPDKAIAALLAALVLDPTHVEVLNWLAFEYRWLRRDEDALQMYRRAVAADTTIPLNQAQVVRMLKNLDRRSESDSALAVMERRFPEKELTITTRWAWYNVWEEYDELEEAASAHRSLSEDRADSYLIGLDQLADSYLIGLDQLYGRLASAGQRMHEQLLRREDRAVSAITVALRKAHHDYLLGSQERAAVIASRDSVLEARMGELEPLEELLAIRGDLYLDVAWNLARLGDGARAREMLGLFDEATPEGFLGEQEPLRHEVVGEIALAEGRVADAIDSYRAAGFGACHVCALPGLARAYDRAGESDSVIAVLERYVSTRNFLKSRLYPEDRALSHERLGQLYDERGDLDNAAKHYSAFVELWADADEQLQPRVRAAQARLEEIVAERG